MNGLQLAKEYYETVARPLLEQSCPALMKQVAVGLWGAGSECLGYDDILSQDHDFEPGFCLLLPASLCADTRAEVTLERIYGKLPREFRGHTRPVLSAVGGNRRGVLKEESVLLAATGTPDGNLSRSDWLTVPEQSLLELTDGEIWRDDTAFFTAHRQRLAFFPSDIRLKKLAGEAFRFLQSVTYHFPRCLKRGEAGAARLALNEGIDAALHLCFLLSSAYRPYFKWTFRAYRALPFQPLTEEEWLSLFSRPPGELSDSPLLKKLSSALREEMIRQTLISPDDAPDRIPDRINDSISDPLLRNDHLLAGI